MKKNVMFRTKEERDFAEAIREDLITLNNKIETVFVVSALLSIGIIVLLIIEMIGRK
jgi:hypothetical protein